MSVCTFCFLSCISLYLTILPPDLPLENCSFLSPSSLHVLLEKLPITLSYDHVIQPQPQ